MVNAVLYFLLTFFACMVGGVSGLGGGIIIKPVMDFMGELDISSINALSSITILTMTTVSIIRSRENARGVNLKMVVTISLGGIIGGVVGHKFFVLFVAYLQDNSMATIIQSGMLIILLGTVIVEELNRKKLPIFQYDSLPVLFMMGLFTGTIGAFLGIGGGLINKPLLILLVGLSTKSAAYGSLSIIFFSQLSNVITMGVTTGYAQIDTTILPFMMVGAIIGGMAGSKIATTISNAKFDRFFLYTLSLVLILNALTLMRNLM